MKKGSLIAYGWVIFIVAAALFLCRLMEIAK